MEGHESIRDLGDQYRFQVLGYRVEVRITGHPDFRSVSVRDINGAAILDDSAVETPMVTLKVLDAIDRAQRAFGGK
jgi:hypothetical protein